MTAGCSAACDPHLCQCEVARAGLAVVTRVLVTAQLSPLLCAPAAVTPGHQPAGNQQSRFYSSTCCSLIITRVVSHSRGTCLWGLINSQPKIHVLFCFHELL